MSCLFQSAAGQAITFQQESLERAKETLGEFDVQTNEAKENLFQSESGQKTDVIVQKNDETSDLAKCTSLFQSASGQTITFADSSLSKAKQILTLDDEQSTHQLTTTFESKSTPQETSSLFQSASGRTLTFAESSLSKAEELLAIEPTKMESEDANSLFQSASGRTLTFTESSMSKTEELLAVEPTKTETSSLFQSASGRTLTFGESSMSKAKEMLENDESTKMETAKTETSSLFQSASGRTLTFSESSMSKAQDILAVEPTSSLFQSASGRTLTFAESSMSKAQEILEVEPTKMKTENGDSLFQSASGRTLTFAEPSMSKAKEMLTEDTGSLFQSASGRTLAFTESSMSKAKEILEEDKNQTSLFQSAGGRALTFAEKSLLQAKEKLAVDEVKKPVAAIPVSEKHPETEKKRKPERRRVGTSVKKKKSKSFNPPRRMKSLPSIARPAPPKKKPKPKSLPAIPLPGASVAYRFPELLAMKRTGNGCRVVTPATALIVRFDETTDEPSSVMEGSLGVEELYKTSIFDPICPYEWFRNHYKWIVWKMSAYQSAFNLENYFNRSQLMYQLKLRYNRELLEAKRPMLKKVFNRDIHSSMPMVLCIAELMEKDMIVLTDGWYAIEAKLDSSLMKRHGKLAIGMKLIVSGAQLNGCESGAEPLECFINNPECTLRPYLQLFANSTRPCRRGLTLGQIQLSLTLPLRSIIPDGGTVDSIAVAIERLYPIAYYDPNTKSFSSDPSANCKSIRRLRLVCLKSRLRMSLSIWSPSEDFNYLLREGQRYKIHHVLPVGHLRLQTTRKSHWERLSDEETCVEFTNRFCTPFNTQIVEKEQEIVDLVGYIVCVIDTTVCLTNDAYDLVLCTNCSKKLKEGDILGLQNVSVSHYDVKYQLLAVQWTELTIINRSEEYVKTEMNALKARAGFCPFLLNQLKEKCLSVLHASDELIQMEGHVCQFFRTSSQNGMMAVVATGCNKYESILLNESIVKVLWSLLCQSSRGNWNFQKVQVELTRYSRNELQSQLPLLQFRLRRLNTIRLKKYMVVGIEC